MVEIDYYKINGLDLRLEIEMRISNVFKDIFGKTLLFMSETCPICIFLEVHKLAWILSRIQTQK